MGYRQSDGRIVLLIPFNRGEGKPRRNGTLPFPPCKVISKGKHYLYTGIGDIMETKLARISQMSAENPDIVFTSLYHLINCEMLRDCHNKMDGSKAVGIDGITKEDYEKNLEENLQELVERLKRKAYKPKPARRVEIPKDNGKTRPLSIYCYEDKLVQEALKRILEIVFEPLFYDEMMGFRPNRGCHKALRKLNGMLEKKYTNYVLDADVKGFFDHIDHEWAVKFIGSKIKDPNILRLVRKMLKAGIMEDFQYEETEEGSGQGSVCSPIIANIYMHYVLTWWFKEKIQPNLRGFSGLVVYADDFVCCFQYKKEAEQFYARLKKRMGHFGLELEESKSRLIEFGRYAEENRRQKGEGKPETFTFLGFTHYCSHSKSGHFRVKRKTSKKKFAKKCKEVHRLISSIRHWTLRLIVAKLNQILVGYYHYYGITDNFRAIDSFRYRVRCSLFYWLNRRSQKISYTWNAFNDMLKVYPLAKPKIYVSIYET